MSNAEFKKVGDSNKTRIFKDMKKSILSVPVYIVFLYLVISIFSCNKENPITPPPPPSGYQFDSARYNWQVDTLLWYGGSTGGYFVLDSSNYYMITDFGQFIHHDENGFHTYQLPDIIAHSVYGKDKNNIYIYGYKIIVGTNNTVLRLVKWNGSSFKDIIIPDTAYHIDYLITSVYILNDNEIWLGTNLGKLIKYDGVNFKYFIFNSNYEFGMDINFFEQENQFYAEASIYAGFGWIDSALIFKYSNDNWENVYKRGYPKPFKYRNFYSHINGFLYSLEEDGLYRFNGSGFIKIMGFESGIFGQYGSFFVFAGGSEENFLIEAPSGNSGNIGLYHWNGIKWSKEIIDKSNPFQCVYFNEGHYFSFTADWFNAYVYKARPKNYSK